jgi:hypothetical protein
VLAGVPAIVNGTLGGRLPPELIPVVGVGLAVAIATFQVTPLVTEVRAARAAAAD